MAVGESIESRFREVIILPSDVPLIKSADVEKIKELASGEKCVVITPSEEKRTNALLIRPPDVIDFKFGGESFPKHADEARFRDVDLEIYRSKNLERYMDNSKDLLKLELRGRGTYNHDFLNSVKKSYI